MLQGGHCPEDMPRSPRRGSSQGDPGWVLGEAQGGHRGPRPAQARQRGPLQVRGEARG